MKRTMVAMTVLAAVFFPVCLSGVETEENDLPHLAARLQEITNAMVNVNKDLVALAKEAPGDEKLYVLGMVDKLGDILILCFYEARLLQLSGKLQPDYTSTFYRSTLHGLEQRAIPRIEAYLAALQTGSHKVRHPSALHMLNEAEHNVTHALKLMRQCIRILKEKIGT